MRVEDLRPWPIVAHQIARAPDGLNNDTYFVSAREGEFVLRVDRRNADPARVQHEHELLGRLLRQELPFQTPAPVKTEGGDTVAVLESPDGPRLATLFFRIPGEPAALSASNAFVGGRSLAQLDIALTYVDLPLRDPPRLGDVHPAVADPIAALETLDLRGELGQVRANFDDVIAAHDALAASLPTQIVHGDFAFPNLLVNGRTVTGLVDFEFAGPDHRPADLACALYVIAVRAEDSNRWPVLESFIRGYRTVLPLDPTEVAALPALMQRRSATGVVHWIGRWRDGISPIDEALARVARSSWFSRWIAVNAPRLVFTAAGEGRAR